MKIQEYVPKYNKLYEEENPPDFVTHHNYVNYINSLADGIGLTSNLKISKRIKEHKGVVSKSRLVHLTLRGIEEEHKIIQDNPDYAAVCVSWISVKSYYLIYNSLLILKYLITGEESSFTSGHTNIINTFKDYLRRNELSFNKSEFNLLQQGKDIMSWRARSGANITRKNVDPEERLKQLMKKLMNYKLEDYQRIEKIKNFHTKENRLKKEAFLTNEDVNLCEFFYWYRIKANYRDLEFINKDIDAEQFKKYYCDYFELTQHYYCALKNLINKLSDIRLGKAIFGELYSKELIQKR